MKLISKLGQLNGVVFYGGTFREICDNKLSFLCSFIFSNDSAIDDNYSVFQKLSVPSHSSRKRRQMTCSSSQSPCMCEEHLNGSHQGHHHAPHTHYILNIQQKWIMEHNGNCELFNDAKCWTKLAHILISSRRLFVDIAVIYYHQNLEHTSLSSDISFNKKKQYFRCSLFVRMFLLRDFSSLAYSVLWLCVRMNGRYYLDIILSERNVTVYHWTVWPTQSRAVHLTVINYLFFYFALLLVFTTATVAIAQTHGFS